jgi:hypothetical protein
MTLITIIKHMRCTKMRKIITSFLMVMVLMVGIASATVTNEDPSGTIITNENVLNISAQSDNPLFSPFRLPTTTYLDVEFDGADELDCVLSGAVYNCSLNNIDISAKEGTYQINITDNDGTVNTANVTVDHSITANDFNFQATDNNVSYTDGCVDTISGIAVSVAQYSNDSFVADINNFTGSSMILPNGSLDFRGYCLDNAGNDAYTGITSYILPASPPELIAVTDLPSTTVCGSGFPCTYSLDGSGLPIDLSLKLTFDKASNISAVLNNGSASISDGYYIEHVLSMDDLRDGVQELVITATDGTNSQDFTINLNVSNTGGAGNVSIDIRGSIIVDPPVEAYVDFVGTPTVEKNNVFPDEWAIVKYTVQTFVYDWTRFRFDTADSAFETPVQVFCEDNYNSTSQDIINNSLSYNISTFNTGTYDETQPAITCNGTGNLTAGYNYDVYVKYPIAADATPGSIAGQFSVGLYNSSI